VVFFPHAVSQGSTIARVDCNNHQDSPNIALSLPIEYENMLDENPHRFHQDIVDIYAKAMAAHIALIDNLPTGNTRLRHDAFQCTFTETPASPQDKIEVIDIGKEGARTKLEIRRGTSVEPSTRRVTRSHTLAMRASITEEYRRAPQRRTESTRQPATRLHTRNLQRRVKIDIKASVQRQSS